MTRPAIYRCRYCDEWTEEPSKHLAVAHALYNLTIHDFTLVRAAQGEPRPRPDAPTQDTTLWDEP